MVTPLFSGEWSLIFGFWLCLGFFTIQISTHPEITDNWSNLSIFCFRWTIYFLKILPPHVVFLFVAVLEPACNTLCKNTKLSFLLSDTKPDEAFAAPGQLGLLKWFLFAKMPNQWARTVFRDYFSTFEFWLYWNEYEWISLNILSKISKFVEMLAHSSEQCHSIRDVDFAHTHHFKL